MTAIESVLEGELSLSTNPVWTRLAAALRELTDRFDIEKLLARGFMNLDIKGAHTSFDQKKAHEASKVVEPPLERLSILLLHFKAILNIPMGYGKHHSHTLSNGNGQGFIATGWLFKNTIQSTYKDVKRLLSIQNVGIEDDIMIMGDTVNRALSQVLIAALLDARTGLKLQHTKTVSYSVNPDDNLIMGFLFQQAYDTEVPALLPNLVSPEDGIKFGGAWLSKNEAFIEGKIKMEIDKRIKALKELNVITNKKVKYLLLRDCDSQKLVHFLRLYDPFRYAKQFKRWDDATENWCRDTFLFPSKNRTIWNNMIDLKVHLPIRLGGLGITSLEKKASASWLSSISVLIKHGSPGNAEINAVLDKIKQSSATQLPLSTPQSALKEHCGILGNTIVRSIENIKIGITPREKLESPSRALPACNEYQLKFMPKFQDFYSHAGRGCLYKWARTITERRHQEYRQQLNPNNLALFDANLDPTVGHSLRGNGVGGDRISDFGFQETVRHFMCLPSNQSYQYLSVSQQDAFGVHLGLSSDDTNGEPANPRYHNTFSPTVPAFPEGHTLHNPAIPPKDQPKATCSLCNGPLDNFCLHHLKCPKTGAALTTHTKTLQSLKGWASNSLKMNVSITEEPQAVFTSAVSATRRGDVLMEFAGIKWLIDFAKTSQNIKGINWTRKQGRRPGINAPLQLDANLANGVAINPINANLVNGEVVVVQVDVTEEAARAEAIARGWRGRVEQVDELVEPARAEMARVDNQEVVVEGQMSNEDVDEQSVLNHNLLGYATFCLNNNFANEQGPHVWEGPLQRNIGIGMGLKPKVEDAAKALKRTEKRKNDSYKHLRQEFKFVPFIFMENGRLGKEAKSFMLKLRDHAVSTGRIKQWEYYTKAYPVWATNIRKAVMAGYERFNQKDASQR